MSIIVQQNEKLYLQCTVEAHRLQRLHFVDGQSEIECKACTAQLKVDQKFGLTPKSKKPAYNVVKVKHGQTVVRCSVHPKKDIILDMESGEDHCQDCAQEKTVWLEKLQPETKKRFDYSTTMHRKSLAVQIFCKTHNKYFRQTPGEHSKMPGCNQCPKYDYYWLEAMAKELNVPFNSIMTKYHGKEKHFQSSSTNYRVDGYVKGKRTVLEYLGCGFHGCKCRTHNVYTGRSSKKAKTRGREQDETEEARVEWFTSKQYTVKRIYECVWKAYREMKMHENGIPPPYQTITPDGNRELSETVTTSLYDVSSIAYDIPDSSDDDYLQYVSSSEEESSSCEEENSSTSSSSDESL